MIGLVCRKKILVTLSFWRDSIFAVSNQDLYFVEKPNTDLLTSSHTI